MTTSLNSTQGVDPMRFMSLWVRPWHDGSVINESASHAVRRGFAPRLGHTKDHHKIGTNGVPAWYAEIMVCVWHCNLTV